MKLKQDIKSKLEAAQKLKGIWADKDTSFFEEQKNEYSYDDFKKVIEELGKVFREAVKREQEMAEQYWNSLPEDQRLLVAVYIFKKLHEHFMEGGSYRYLIYDRLGFSIESGAYGSLQAAGALDIHNFISGEGKKEGREQ